jgi:uncharacterized phage infection (PIP) family protein YhgE
MLVLALSAAACGGDDGNDSADACAAAKSFTDAVTALTQVNVVTDGTDALTTAAQNVAEAAGALESAAKDQFGSQASAVKAAYANLAESLATAPSVAIAAQAITEGVANIKAQQAALEEEISSACS